MSQSAAVAERTLVGNRWVLVGGIGYLLEWVAIIWVGALGVGETVVRGTSADDLLDSYVGHVDALTTMAGWFSLVLLFRILLFIGLRQALADSGYRHPLMDFAVAAAAVSVTLEVASYGLGAAAGGLAEDGDRAGMLALDQAAAGINLMIAGGLGVAIVCSAYCMWSSGLFPMVLNVIGPSPGWRSSACSSRSRPPPRRCSTSCSRSRSCSGSGCSGPASSAGGVRRVPTGRVARRSTPSRG